jgi:putative ABC transport system permease protein
MTARAKLALRLALREMRGGVRGFLVFLACLTLGVAAISGVASVTRTVDDAIARESQAILGGDVSFVLAQRSTSAEERAFIAARGRISEVSSLRTMARRLDGEDQVLVELKAVDGAYPLFGDFVLAGGGSLQQALAPGADAEGAVADQGLLDRLDLKPGDVVTVGSARFRINGVVDTEPDRLSEGGEFGPRLMISSAGLAATGLIQPGSLVRTSLRLRLPDGAGNAELRRFVDEANRRFPDAGWRVLTRERAAPGLQNNVDRLAQFLTLVGLAALLIGGVGVANAVGAYLAAKRSVIATFKSLGAPGALVVEVYLIQIMALAVAGILAGLVIGAIIPFIAVGFLKNLIPAGASAEVYPLTLLASSTYGVATALAFALWPLGRARDVPPSVLLRDRADGVAVQPRWIYRLGALAAAAMLAMLSIVLAHDRMVALVFLVAAGGSFVLLQAVARLVMELARQAPRVASTELRFAIANIHRPGALTPSVILSLGLGLALLSTLALVDGNLRRELTANIPAQAPSFFFLDVQNRELDAFTGLLTRLAPDAKVEHVPMLRGRITRVAGTPADQVKPSPETRWVLTGDRGVTYADAVPPNSTLVAGDWWGKGYSGPPLVSLEAGVAEGIGVKVGDTLSVNVLGRTIEARIANLRRVEWDRLAINFVLVFSPNTFAGAPHSELATLTLPGGGTAAREKTIMRAVGQQFPAVSAIRVKEALDRINDILGQIVTAILAASSVTLATAVLVLGGALAAGHHRRLYDAVILKTLGATRRQLLTAFGLEYLMLGVVAAVFGLLAGSGAAWFVLTRIMQSKFTFLPGTAFATVALAALFTLVFGLAGTWRALGQKAAPVLRNL